MTSILSTNITTVSPSLFQASREVVPSTDFAEHALTSRESKALDTAQKLVSTTLIKPILAQARAARDAPAPWGQTQAEKQFGALLDNRIADDISRASNFNIAQRVADQMLKNMPVSDESQHPHTPVDILG